MILLDTDVWIDILRQHPPAIRWLNELADTDLLLSGFVLMELIQGCQNKQEIARLQKLVRPYYVVWPTEIDCNEALATYAKRHLSDNLGLLDALIGQQAVSLGVPLYTFNQKHYRAIPKLKLLSPYQR